jgi:hypothetical protein
MTGSSRLPGARPLSSSAPPRVQLDEVQFDKTRIGILPVLRHLQQAAFDVARFVIDLALEGTNDRVDPVSVAREVVDHAWGGNCLGPGFAFRDGVAGHDRRRFRPGILPGILPQGRQPDCGQQHI